MKRLILFIIALPLLITTCEKFDENKKYSTNFFAMNTYITIDLYGENTKETAKVVSDEINRLENLWSATAQTSEIYKINNSNKTVTVSDETINIIKYSVEMAEKTDEALNPAIYPLINEWGFTTGDYKIPDNDEINDLMNKIDYHKIYINKNDVTVEENIKIDLGAVAKGYASDIVAKIIKDKGIKSGIVNLGGNVQAIGKKPDGSYWKVGLRNPFYDGNIGVLEISDCAVVTSGNYEKYFIGDDGKRYCHIIDSKTGFPVNNGLLSVTVIGKEGKKCDALSTALFVMGKDKAIEYWKANKDFELILITENREIFITPELKHNFKISDKSLKSNVIS